jgi:hypothetical protein
VTTAPFWRTIRFMKRVAWTGAIVAALCATWSGEASAQNGSTQPPPDAASYHVRLQDLQERVDEIHQQLRRMQTRQKMLAESAPMAVSTVQADVEVRDLTTSAFVLTGVRVWLDDQLVYGRTADEGALGDLHAVTAFHGTVTPGEHAVRVEMHLAGNGAVLPYMRAYRFQLRDERRFTAVEGHPSAVTVGVYDRGDVTTPFEQRPAIAVTAR